ncbi:MAG TPA: hypothetical protein GXX40_07995 [Firmicutes bacterium]|nr:hypothetical protein [Bacillota bacterium]
MAGHHRFRFKVAVRLYEKLPVSEALLCDSSFVTLEAECTLAIVNNIE